MKKVIPVLCVFALFVAACARQPATSFDPSGSAAPVVTQAAEQIITTQPVTTDSQTSSTSAAPQAAATQPLVTEPAVASTTVAVPDTGAGVVLYVIDPTQSKVTYEVGETFLNQNNRFNTAIGITQGINGEITIDRSAPQNSSLGPVTVDISQLTSDQPRRDNAIRDRFLESARFPLAGFTPTAIEGLPTTLQEGVDIPLKINGDLKIREVTRPVTFDTIVRLQGDSLTGQATTQFLMSDFGFGPISIAGIVNTEDQVKVTFDFVAKPQD